MSIMSESLKPMDDFADMQVPFDVATFCRGHKFALETVALLKAVRMKNARTEAMRRAEVELENSETSLKAAVDAARRRMENSKDV